MINKNNLWFLTLFSLILILGVYYVTLPSDVLDKIKIKDKVEEPVVKEENPLIALRVSLEETRKTSKEKLEKELTKTEITSTEKNNIYEQLKYSNEIQSKEEKLEKKIKKQLNINCFTKIDNKDIEVICISKEQNKHLANNIMRLIQENDTNKLNITVKFQKK